MIDRRRLLRRGLTGGAAMLAGSVLPGGLGLGAAEVGALRVVSLKFGSLNWLLETIKAEGFAQKAGLKLDIVEVATNQAGPVALLANEVDVIVSDWPWALRQRALGQKLKFRPYSSSLGSVMVAKDGPVKSLDDLKGRRLGIAGSAIDKSWLLLRAYSRKVLGYDIAEAAEPVFGAAPLVAEELKNGRVDACLNFWTFAARLEGAGFRPLIGVDEMMEKLGIEPSPPLVGFVWREETAAAKGAALKAFFAAVDEANHVLAMSDTAFERLKPLMRAESDAEYFALKAYYRSGIPKPWGEKQTASAQKLFELLVEEGGKELVGNGTTFDPVLFDGAGNG
ncbi:MAG: ABC transporter substrate-binding protein [Hyphomicrobiaceae bacterium]|nr:ABC transporter substrate-binding protein [Hyphomicrobiaceae bacterium]